jgi:flagellar protein FliL
MADVPVVEPAPKAKKADKASDKAKDAANAPKAPAGKKKRLIFIAIGVVVLGGVGAGAFLLFGGKHAEPAKGKAKTATAQKAEKEDEEKEDKSEAAHKGPPIFVALDPPFVVNFEAQELVRFLQVTAQIMSRDLETIEVVKANEPIIRNDLLLLFGNQKYQTIATREGKEALRAQALETVRNVVKAGGGKPKQVEAVYFTSFVMQ